MYRTHTLTKNTKYRADVLILICWLTIHIVIMISFTVDDVSFFINKILIKILHKGWQIYRLYSLSIWKWNSQFPNDKIWFVTATGSLPHEYRVNGNFWPALQGKMLIYHLSTFIISSRSFQHPENNYWRINL